MSQLGAQTVMWRRDQSACNQYTDVVWVKTALDGIAGGAIGKSVCVSHVSWGVCEQFWVLIDQPAVYVESSYAGGSGWYTINIQYFLRHELGHTAGLHHGHSGYLFPGFGPMVSAWIPNGDPQWAAYLAYHPFQTFLIDTHV